MKGENLTKAQKALRGTSFFCTKFCTKDDSLILEALEDLGAKEYGFIYHDKDKWTAEDVTRLGGVDGNGNTIKEGMTKDGHYHIYFKLPQTYFTKISNVLEIPFSCIDLCQKGKRAALRYCLHINEKSKAQGKHVYSADELTTNIENVGDVINGNECEVSEAQRSASAVLEVIQNTRLRTIRSVVEAIQFLQPELLPELIKHFYFYKNYLEELKASDCNMLTGEAYADPAKGAGEISHETQFYKVD